MNFAPIDLPVIETPLPKDVRRTILQHAHEFILAWGTVRPAKEVVYTQLVPHLAAPLARVYGVLVDEEHHNIGSELAMRDETIDMEKFRSLWVGTMIAKVFAKTPWGQPGHWMDFFFDYELLDGPLSPRREPWKNIPAFCEYMADRAIRMMTEGRQTGQALAYFGIVAADLEGIEIPGYVPPYRDNPVVSKVVPAVIATKVRSDFAMSLVLGLFS